MSADITDDGINAENTHYMLFYDFTHLTYAKSMMNGNIHKIVPLPIQ